MPRGSYRHAPIKPPPALTEADHVTLRMLKAKPLAEDKVAKSIADRLFRGSYIRPKLMKSENPNHYGALLTHWQITERGHQELARADKAT